MAGPDTARTGPFLPTLRVSDGTRNGAEALRRAPWVRSFFTIYQGRAERAGPGWPSPLGKRRARMMLTRMRRNSRRSPGGAFPRETLRAGRRQPHLGPPGHGGVGAQAVPAARRTGRAPRRSAPGARAARAGHPPGAPVSSRAEITRKGASRHT